MTDSICWNVNCEDYRERWFNHCNITPAGVNLKRKCIGYKEIEQ